MQLFRLIWMFIAMTGVLYGQETYPSLTAIDIQVFEEVAVEVVNSFKSTIPARQSQKLRYPEIGLSTDHYKSRIATYNATLDIIEVDTLALQVCKAMGNGERYRGACAFLLGHELQHWYDCRVDEILCTDTHFMSLHKDGATKADERNADIMGGIHAMLLGYDIQSVLPPLIDELYDAYQLKGKVVSNYPSYTERKQMAAIAQQNINELDLILNTANVLLVSENYKAAEQLYQAFDKKFTSPEVQANIGVLHLLQGLNFSEFNNDNFIYPIEIASQTRLTKSSELPLPKSKSVPRRRADFYKIAQQKFDNLIQDYPSNHKLLVYKMCSELLLGNLSEVEFTFKYKIHADFLSAEYYQQARMLYALALVRQQASKSKGLSILKEISQSKFLNLQRIARHNLEVVKGSKKVYAPNSGCNNTRFVTETRQVANYGKVIEISTNLDLHYLVEDTSIFVELKGDRVPYKKVVFSTDTRTMRMSSTDCDVRFLGNRGEAIWFTGTSGGIINKTGKFKLAFGVM